MKKLFKSASILFYLSGFMFLVVHNFVVTGTKNEDFARDLFGFQIPNPPLWTSHIPYLSGLLMYIYQMFSWHGLLGLTIFITLILISSFFNKLGNDKTE